MKFNQLAEAVRKKPNNPPTAEERIELARLMEKLGKDLGLEYIPTTAEGSEGGTYRFTKIEVAPGLFAWIEWRATASMTYPIRRGQLYLSWILHFDGKIPPELSKKKFTINRIVHYAVTYKRNEVQRLVDAFKGLCQRYGIFSVDRLSDPAYRSQLIKKHVLNIYNKEKCYFLLVPLLKNEPESAKLDFMQRMIENEWGGIRRNPKEALNWVQSVLDPYFKTLKISPYVIFKRIATTAHNPFIRDWANYILPGLASDDLDATDLPYDEE